MSTVWMVIGFVALWMLGAAVVFAFIDSKTGDGFRRWYDDAPYAWLRALIWIFWPVILFLFIVESIGGVDE